MKQAIILGAGLSGLIAACKYSGWIIEKADKVYPHRALLRFRSDEVSKLTGIPFKKVRVYKSVFSNGYHYREPSIQLQNKYSLKVTGMLLPRSVGNLEPVDRYIAPYDFQQMLAERHKDRLCLSTEFVGIENDLLKCYCIEEQDFTHTSRDGMPIISTMPISVMARAMYNEDLVLNRSGIAAFNYKIRNCEEVYQTIYFPGSETEVYRASITGDVLIIETTGGEVTVNDLMYVTHAFGMPWVEDNLTFMNKSVSSYGKIVPNPEATKPVVWRLTRDFGIFSLGRFATWRNILLDDVVSDIYRIDSMSRLHGYELDKEFSNES